MKRLILTLAMVTAAAPPTALADRPILRVAPTHFHFGTRAVGTETIKSALITNGSDSPIYMTFEILRMPDDYGFEAPGFTCPPAGGIVLAPGESCEATAAFRPSEFFAGDPQTASVQVVASDPSTGAALARVLLTMTGTGK